MRMQLMISVAFVLIAANPGYASILGEELIPLAKLVAGQAIELDRLADAVGVAKDQRELLIKINDGIDRTTRQIESIESIIERSKGLDPTAVRTLAEITDFLQKVKTLQAETSEVVSLKLLLADQAIAQSGLQSDTAYKMGQEMVYTGTQLAEESKYASPGRANQISAAAASSQMLAQGVQLQTLAQISQTQAMQLELQKAQIERELQADGQRNRFFMGQLSAKSRGRRAAAASRGAE